MSTDPREIVERLREMATRYDATELCVRVSDAADDALEALLRERDEARSRVAEVESAMRDWCVCVHCGSRFPTNTHGDHGATCTKHPQRRVEAERDAATKRAESAEAQVVALREFAANHGYCHADRDGDRSCESCGDDVPHHEPGCAYMKLMHSTAEAAAATRTRLRAEGFKLALRYTEAEDMFSDEEIYDEIASVALWIEPPNVAAVVAEMEAKP